MSEALAAFLDRSAADLAETARTAAAQALLPLGGEYAEASGRLPAAGQALRQELDRLYLKMGHAELKWRDGDAGDQEWSRCRGVLYAASHVAANAVTWAGRDDAPAMLVRHWAGLSGITAS